MNVATDSEGVFYLQVAKRVLQELPLLAEAALQQGTVMQPTRGPNRNVHDVSYICLVAPTLRAPQHCSFYKPSEDLSKLLGLHVHPALPPCTLHHGLQLVQLIIHALQGQKGGSA